MHRHAINSERLNKEISRLIDPVKNKTNTETEVKPPQPLNRSIDKTYNMYTWSSHSRATFLINAYVIQNYVKSIAGEVLSYNVEATQEFEYDYKKQDIINVHGQQVFNYENKLYVIDINSNCGTVTINSNNDISEIIEKIKYEIKYNNPIRNKHIQITNGSDGVNYIFKNPPSTTFDDIIMDEKIKEDIYDNTIFHLENLNDNNGIIFYGNPGVGKSAICQAIINKALEKKYSTCFVISQVYYTALSEFINNFLAPCILIFEDIDSFGQSRDVVRDHGGGLADFLQFMSGLYERDDAIIVIATTNYIEHLDSAIANRPCRFNRKYEFKLPTNDEINKMIDMFFGSDIVDYDLKKLCHNKKLTGSHIKEIQRTSMLLSKKRQKEILDVFEDSVNIVLNNFSVAGEASSVGFGK